MDTEQRLIAGLGRAISAQRTHLKLSQSALARDAKVSRPNLNRIELGKYDRCPDLSTLIRVAEGLQLPVWELLARALDKPAESEAA